MSKSDASLETTSRIFNISLQTENSYSIALEVQTEFTTKAKPEVAKNVPVSSQPKKKWTTIDRYQLRKVSKEELFELRLSKLPGIVYKEGEHLFYASVPSTLHLNSSASMPGTHKCGKSCSSLCKGCPRTSALTVAFQERIGNTFYNAVTKSWRLEKYPFIEKGIECFNMGASNDACLILACRNYVKNEKKSTNHTTLADARLGLAHFYWDDFDGDYSQMKIRMFYHSLQYTKSQLIKSISKDLYELDITDWISKDFHELDDTAINCISKKLYGEKEHYLITWIFKCLLKTQSKENISNIFSKFTQLNRQQIETFINYLLSPVFDQLWEDFKKNKKIFDSYKEPIFNYSQCKFNESGLRNYIGIMLASLDAQKLYKKIYTLMCKV